MTDTNQTTSGDGLHCVYGKCQGIPHGPFPCHPGCRFQGSVPQPLSIPQTTANSALAAILAKPDSVRTSPPPYPGGHWKAVIVALSHIGDPIRPYAYIGTGETKQAAIDHLKALEAADTWSAENAKQA